tara:strand:- start:423 stop:1145 length:723 start_codon:yes stop_codon:yes gene_type:complete
MNILITGSNGFLGKSLIKYLKTNTIHIIHEFSKDDKLSDLEKLISKIDIVFHFAGVNRTSNKINFEKINVGLTKKICKIIRKNPNTKLFYASSIQANYDNDYGLSKKRAEKICLNLQKNFQNKVYILRLPRIFGVGSKPYYNSVVATFCYNTVNKIKLNIIEPEKEIELLFVEDLCSQLNDLMNKKFAGDFVKFKNVKKISIGELASTIKTFKNNNHNIKLPTSKDLLKKNLYKTFISFI